MYTSIKKASKFAISSTTTGSDIYVAEDNTTTGTVALSSIMNAAKASLVSTFVVPPSPPTVGQVAQYKNGQWTAVSNLNLTSTPSIMSGTIKKFFTNINNYALNIRALTTNNELIGWGYTNQIEPSGYTGPLAPAYARFFQADGTDYLINNPDITVKDVQWSDYMAVALLTDGTVWITGRLGPASGPGYLVRDIGTQTSGGFSKINFSDEVVITDISMTAGANENQTTIAAKTNDNNVYIWGENNFNQCGFNYYNDVPSPTKIKHPGIVNKVAKISVAGNSVSEYGCNTVIITTDGKAWVAGANNFGQLGTGDTNIVYNFTQPKVDSNTYLQDVADIAVSGYARGSNLFFIKTDGTVWAAGRNNRNQLGNNTTTDSSYFIQVGSLAGVSKLGVSGANNINCTALTSDGKVYTWGYNNEGQCGTGTITTTVPVPTLVNSSGATKIIANMSKDGACNGFIKNNQLYTAGYRAWTDSFNDYPISQPVFKQHFIRDVVDAIFLSNGPTHAVTMFLTSDGNLYGNGQPAYQIFGTYEGSYVNAQKIM